MAALTAAWCDSPACTEGVKHELLGGTAVNITESLKVILVNKKRWRRSYSSWEEDSCLLLGGGKDSHIVTALF